MKKIQYISILRVISAKLERTLTQAFFFVKTANFRYEVRNILPELLLFDKF